MQILNVMVAIGGDSGNTVPKYGVTPSEIAVLTAIHGDGAVFDIDPVGDEKRSSREEVSRLRANYGNAHDTENQRIVDILFPGAAARAFDTLDELGLPDDLMKPTARASTQMFGGKGDHDGDGKVGGSLPSDDAEPVEDATEADGTEPEAQDDAKTDDGLDDTTVVNLKKLAEDEHIDLGDATLKADIIAVIRAARQQDDSEDEVEDMGDQSGDDLFN